MRKIIIRVEDRGNGISISAGHKSDDGANHVEEIVAFSLRRLSESVSRSKAQCVT